MTFQSTFIDSSVSFLRLAVTIACFIPAALVPSTGYAEEPDPGALAESTNPARQDPKLAAFFTEQVAPVLREHCWKCHGLEKSLRGNLSLMSREDLLRGGDSGPALALDKPQESLLLEAIHYESFEMPPQGKLPEAKLKILERWIEQKAPWEPGSERAARRQDHHEIDERVQASKQHWAYQPIRRPDVPTMDPTWGHNAIDAFIVRGLRDRDLRPARPADKTTLLRRLYYTVTGLPPSPADVQAFLEDSSPHAYEKVVDQLLDSPQYGVHWARHWLDLVRYAETNSYERDGAKPNVWRYRDYVVDAFNQDKPYDQFIREQLAGDELEPPTRDGLIATGFYRLGIWDDEPVDREQALYDQIDDIVSTTGQVFLGLNIGCARCHDHKIDPLYQRDYYQLVAFFNGINSYGVRSAQSVAANSLRPLATPDEVAKHDAAVKHYQQQLREIEQRMKEIEKTAKKDFVPVEHEEFRHKQNRIPLLKKRVPDVLSQEEFDEYVALSKQWDELKRSPPRALEQALCVTEIGPQPRETHVLIRGNAHAKGDVVLPAFPTVLGQDPPSLPAPVQGRATCGRRTALANWIASPDNPLTARVIVNRLWQFHFGRGIVRTPNDFGISAPPPTHPDLLDYLATELIQSGWRLKRIQRMILLSAAYQMSSTFNPAFDSIDPNNDYLWRFPPQRLQAESIRDSILAVSGDLNLQMGGPSVYVTMPAEVLAGQSRPGSGWGHSPPDQQARRTLYIHIKRSLIVPLVAAFDGADTDVSCPERFVSTQPTQALLMLNSDFIQEQSRRFAADLRESAGDSVERQVREGLWRVCQRPPTEGEIQRGVDFVNRMMKQHGKSPQRALEYYCLMLLNLNEFMFID